VDHFASQRSNKHHGDYWTQRYYVAEKHFGGPGRPIFMVIGGEGEALGLFYPFVHDIMAKKFKAYVVQPELRFYGKSQPLGGPEYNTGDALAGLLTTEQAVQDFLRILRHTQDQLGCSRDKTSKDYCPVIAVGGSYPGFISALLRITHPDIIDISYASSAPLLLYAQDVNPNDYFELVTRTADIASPGCSVAVRKTLEDIHQTILAGKDIESDMSFILDQAEQMNICVDHHAFPHYIGSKEMFAQEVTMVVGQNFADFNMDFYPPTDESTTMRLACNIFQDDSLNTHQKMDGIFRLIDSSNGVERTHKDDCFDLRSQIPDGPHGRISGSDWTGLGSGSDARSWAFQCCTELIVQTGFSDKSMFIPRPWSLEWLTEHCQMRYNVSPTPTHLVDKFHFDDLSQSTRILFTNGLNDGWSLSSILSSPHPGITVLNFPNGAHHSDLAHVAPSDKDTTDIQQGHRDVMKQIGTWLEEIEQEKRQD